MSRHYIRLALALLTLIGGALLAAPTAYAQDAFDQEGNGYWLARDSAGQPSYDAFGNSCLIDRYGNLYAVDMYGNLYVTSACFPLTGSAYGSRYDGLGSNDASYDSSAWAGANDTSTDDWNAWYQEQSDYHADWGDWYAEQAEYSAGYGDLDNAEYYGNAAGYEYHAASTYDSYTSSDEE